MTSTALVISKLSGSFAAVAASPESAGTWYRKAYRRAVVDMHIPDWDEQFLSQVDIGQYVANLKTAQAQSIVAYVQSHTGLFNYPTKVGQHHRGLKGRDLVREILDGCHAEGIAVVMYVSLIFDRWASDNHPDWRIVRPGGEPLGKGGRYGFNCPNSPYREYVRSWVEEICTRYDFEGIRFDMTFWPGICYCAHCRQRFRDEVGGEVPTTVDWLNPQWVAFQRKREQWLAEFAGVATSTVRKLRPRASVEHQSSTFPLPWTNGVAMPLVEQMDFLQGDFYGDSWQGSFVRKLLEDLTPNRPFGFETSFSYELQDHTARKSEPLLEAKASAAIADGAAFIFIDAIDPIGTLNPMVYDRMGRIFSRLMPYYEHLGGERVADIAVYYSLESKFDFASNGKPVEGNDVAADAHTASVMAVVKKLAGRHMSFAVVTKKSLGSLSKYRLLVLPQVCMMDADEVAAIRRWVEAGGRILATGWTSLVDKDGHLQKDFMLADVFGVSLVEPKWEGWRHYIAPTEAAQNLFGEFNNHYPPFARCVGHHVKAAPQSSVLATTTLPWPAPDPTEFSSIHSDPPWAPTDRPEIVQNTFGKGRSIYCSSAIETMPVMDDLFANLMRTLCERMTVEVEAPTCVEATLFHQPDRNRYIFSLVNFQRDLPNIPVENISVRLCLPSTIRSVKFLPEPTEIAFTQQSGAVTFVVPRLETLKMCALETS